MLPKENMDIAPVAPVNTFLIYGRTENYPFVILTKMYAVLVFYEQLNVLDI